MTELKNYEEKTVKITLDSEELALIGYNGTQNPDFITNAIHAILSNPEVLKLVE